MIKIKILKKLKMHLVLKMSLNSRLRLKIALKVLPVKSSVMNVIVVVGWMKWLDWIS